MPPGLREGAICRRQTTFWELTGLADERWRVHFSGKVETQFSGPLFSAPCPLREHPLLALHVEPAQQVHVGRAPGAPAELVRELDLVCIRTSREWRKLSDYANPDVAPERVLSNGYGLLATIPSSLCDDFARVLTAQGVDWSSMAIGPARASGRRANSSFAVLEFSHGTAVVAEAFRFERIVP